MDHQPLVTVIMIFKDAAPYLSEAVDSVLSQTWPYLELVLVDDGGTDGSDAIALKLVAQNPGRVRVLTHLDRANCGTGPSRWLGIQAAGGELTAFLDADDRWDPGHLDHEVRLLLAHPEAGMVCGRVRNWHSWSGSGTADGLSPLPFAPGSVVPPPRMLAAVLRNGGLAVHPGSLLVRTFGLQSCAAAMVAFTSTYEDQVMNSVLQLRYPAVISAADTVWYRQHRSSLSATALRAGFSAMSGSSVSRVQFLRWLDQVPELAREHADPALRNLLDDTLREQADVSARAVGRVRRATAPARSVVRSALRLAAGPTRLMHGTKAGPGPTAEELQAVGTSARPSPVHSVYANRFLHRWGEDLRGRIVEVGPRRWATLSRMPHAVEHVAQLEDLEEGAYDCVLAPVDLSEAEDPRSALMTLRRALPPGGALLVLLPGLRRVDPALSAPTRVWTNAAAGALFADIFSPDLTTVDQQGNSSTVGPALLHRRPPRGARLLRRDASLPVLVTVRCLVPA